MFGLSPVKVAAALCAFLFATGQVQSLRADTALVEGATAAIMASDAEMLSSMMADPAFRIAERLEGEYAFLHLAAMVGDPAIIESLLVAGAEIDAVDGVNGWTPLMHATHQGHEAAARLLLERGANQNVTGTDLSTAAILARYSGLTALFETADTRAGTTRPPDQSRLDDLLFRAVEAGDRGLVEALIEQGADPNAISETGWTPLLYASMRRSRLLFGTLWDNGARPDNSQSVSFVEAAFLGMARPGNRSEVDHVFFEFLRALRLAPNFTSPRDDDERAQVEHYRAVAEQLELDAEFMEMFPLLQRSLRPPLPEIELAQDMSREDWQRVQRTLKNLGLYLGAIDGIPGPQTRNAVYAYFRQYFDGLTETAVDFCNRAALAYASWPKAAAQAEVDRTAALRRGNDEFWLINFEISDFSADAIYFLAHGGESGVRLAFAGSSPDYFQPGDSRSHEPHYSCDFTETTSENPLRRVRLSSLGNVEVGPIDCGSHSLRRGFIRSYALGHFQNPYYMFFIDLCDRNFGGPNNATGRAGVPLSDRFGNVRGMYEWGSF